MKKLKARLNWGRWLVDCPKEDGGALEVIPGNDTQFICPVCYPSSIAIFVGLVKGRVEKVPDVSARRTAKTLAEKNGDVYEIEYPSNIKKVLEAVKARPVQNQNWEPGETLTFLKRENKQNGV